MEGGLRGRGLGTSLWRTRGAVSTGSAHKGLPRCGELQPGRQQRQQQAQQGRVGEGCRGGMVGCCMRGGLGGWVAGLFNKLVLGAPWAGHQGSTPPTVQKLQLP